MGQAAGVKRRKGRAGNYRFVKKRRGGRERDIKNKTKGLISVGLEDSVGSKNLLNRLNAEGIVADLRKFQKPNPRMLIEEAAAKPWKDNKKTTVKSNLENTPRLVGNLLAKRNEKIEKLRDIKMRNRCVAIPKPLIQIFSHYLDNYGEDYRAMARDPHNLAYQMTPQQIRKQIKRFKDSGAPFAEYLKDRGLLVPTEQKEGEEDDEGEEDEMEVETEAIDEEKLKRKIKELEQKKNTLKQSLTKKRSRPAIVEEDDLSEDEESDEEELPAPAEGEGKKKNMKRKMRQKKAEKAKKKLLLKATRTMRK